MSCCNLHISPDRVWLARDTLKFLDGRPYSLGSMSSVYPHLYALAGFRGLAALHHRLDVAMNGGARWVDADAAAAGLPARLRRWRHELRDELRGAKVDGQIWLAGWSPERRAFAGWLFSSDQDFERVELPVPGTWLNPGCEDAGYVPPAEIDHPDKLVRCVAAQREMAAANLAAGGDELGIGGEVLLAELTSAGISVRKAFRFADYAEIKEQIRADR